MPVKKFVKDTIEKGNFFFRCSTRHLRVLPDFLIVGAQKCGTSSLYRNLVKHPSVIPAFVKEIYFFNNSRNYFQKGVGWYKAYFPSLLYKYYSTHICGNDFLTGEATPGYMFHPHAPKRISELLPEVKIIILLRNPVDRAYSHYYHEVKRKRETLSFEDAIRMEEERLRGEFDRIMKDENYTSSKYVHYSYLLRGIYVDQLKRVYSYFNKNQVIILKSEDFFKDSQATIEKVLQFLGLSGWQPKDFKKANVGSYQKMDPAVRSWLLDYFEPHNHKLYEYLGVNFGWEK
ncbi:MAG: sulfotransferase domain-containing protein [Planctomycetes bacterium]|nr:sulfotransferase domain-containing protein [Planctomycetota bacterium]